MKYVKPDVTVMEFAVLERLANADPFSLDVGDRENGPGSTFEIINPDEGVETRDPSFD